MERDHKYCLEEDEEIFTTVDQVLLKLRGIDGFKSVNFSISGMGGIGKIISPLGGYHRLFSDAFELEANDEGNPISGGKIRLSWLRDMFGDLNIDQDHPQWPAYIRAYFLYVIGSYIIPDTSTGLVSCQYLSLLSNINHIGRYAWGAAVWANMHSCLQRGVINGLSYALMVFVIEHIRPLRDQLIPAVVELPIELPLMVP